MEKKKRPEFLTEEHLNFLDDLQEEEGLNMCGAKRPLMREFPRLDGEQALQILLYWTSKFSERQKQKKAVPEDAG